MTAPTPDTLVASSPHAELHVFADGSFVVKALVDDLRGGRTFVVDRLPAPVDNGLVEALAVARAAAELAGAR